ncbi:hypothetical protein VaNZ11_011878 [Volvox africanus]|uniref:Sodium/calcium exchanger membrane region domain-containing protein n=1 Tax=Volvox africanus TaxID=51714 RepID=A0ABQ5SCJ3_9CHLO|nr:hypothetical protein VaNZ11_011878 [Volvox africanus]
MACSLHSRPRAVPSTLLVVVTLALYAFLHMSAIEARPTRARRLNEIQSCQPEEVPRKERCEYVRTHASCRPEDGWIPYLEIHYCYLSQMEGVSTGLFLLWIAILFGLMLVIAERFFCPSLELISEYLRLPPCVAGATLLSFGNGAPDVFTQLAAISQGDSDTTSPGAIAMALSEPLGSGLFVGNIVFGLVVFFSGLNEVRVQRSYFLKDCLFYLGGVVTVFAFLLHGEVMVWEVALLAGYYLAFIIATILLSRGDEPVHADPRLHEVPHRLQPLDSYLRESFRRIRDLSVTSQASQISDIDTDAEAPLLEGSSPKKQQQKYRPQPQPQPQLLRGRTLERIEESAPGLSGELEDGGGRAANINGDGGDDHYFSDDDVDVDLALLDKLRAGGGRGGGDDGTGIGDSSSCAADTVGGSLIGTDHGSSFRGNQQRPGDSGSRSVGYKPPPPVQAATAAMTPPWTSNDVGCTLGADSTSGLAFYRQLGADGSFTCGFGRGGLDAMTPSMRRENSGKPPGRMEQLWRRLERPVLALLSLFIPRVALGTRARYRKTCAVLLPPLLPTLVGWAQGWLDEEHSPGGFWRQRWWLGSTGAGLIVAVAAVRFFPRKGHLHGYAAGIATVVVFCEAMLLLDASAGELVSTAVALGQIFGISPSLLGATLLAWGNSVSDLVSNITLAKDGLPSMAITACFASPMFVLLAGLVTSLTYATRHGNMKMPEDLALKVLYGCSSSILLMWALVVPLVFRFRLTPRVGVLAVIVYLVYQTVYIWAIIHDSRGGR